MTKIKHLLSILFVSALFLLPLAAQDEKPLTFQNYSDTTGAFTLTWDEVPLITETGPQTARAILKNESRNEASFDLIFSSADTVTPVDETGTPVPEVRRSVTIPAGGTAKETFSFIGTAGTYNAHYPLRLCAHSLSNADLPRDLLAVRVVEFRRPSSKKELNRTVIQYGGVSLLDKDYTARCCTLGGDEKTLGISFAGTDTETGVAVHRYRTELDTALDSVSAHPPYKPVGGSLWLDYPVRLPDTPRVEFDYSCAITTPPPTEPASDGVTFRIWLTPDGEPFGGAKTVLADEIHTDSKTWVPRKADLSAFSGQNVTLTAEFNTGPKNDSICDTSFIGGMTISGLREDGTPFLPETQNQKQNPVPLLPEGEPAVIPLAGGFQFELIPGEHGIFDAVWRFREPDGEKRTLEFRGITLSVGALDLTDPSTKFVTPPVCRFDKKAGRINTSASVLFEDELLPIEIDLYAENGLLIAELPDSNPKRISGFRPGPFSTKGKRIYFAHGIVAEDPERFSIPAEGHRLASSHVAVDFENGISLLTGTEIPPDSFDVDPDRGIWGETISGVNRMAFLPAADSAFAAAIRYRKSAPWHASPSAGAARKAGRLIFDDWSGNYKESANRLRKAFACGVTDALYIRHNWQRWGYDVRLPDIWGGSESDAVNTYFGTLADLRELAGLTRSHNVPFALHDNYIDFYPDADGFSYSRIVFNDDGTPQKAWINYYAETQSYRTRPDMLQRELLRNLEYAKKWVPETDAYFVDVFTSISQMNFLEENGTFHTKRETREAWQNAFLTIGEKLAHIGPNGEKITAITISEAGSDGLIGKIDGADCQWLGLSRNDRPWTMPVKPAKWARTPWFAAVNHTNFIRHGAGYEERYRASMLPALHGIMSDDYISLEILGGVDLMVNFNTIWPGSVRKDRLAGPVTRARKAAEIEEVRFAGTPENPDLGKQTVRWSNGDTVYANRLEGDWSPVSGITIPHYGYAVIGPDASLKSGIIRNPENETEVIELADSGDSFYLNGRGNTEYDFLPVEPLLLNSEIISDTQFNLTIGWRAEEPISGNYTPFVTFNEMVGYAPNRGGWSGPRLTAIPASFGPEDAGTVITENSKPSAVPEDIPNGRYIINAGLTRTETGAQPILIGDTADMPGCAVGILTVNRSDAKTPLKIEPFPPEEDRSLFKRLQPNKTPIHHRGVSTLGAVEVKTGETGWRIFPIPGFSEFDVTLNTTEIGRSIAEIRSQGKSVPLHRTGSQVTFKAESGIPEGSDEPITYEIVFE